MSIDEVVGQQEAWQRLMQMEPSATRYAYHWSARMR